MGGVIRGCVALVIASPVVSRIATTSIKWGTQHKDLKSLLDKLDRSMKGLLFPFRLWCIVEIHAAIAYGLHIIVRAGNATCIREDGVITGVLNDTENAAQMLENLSHVIDVESASCAVQADYDREIANVRSGAGVRAVNSQVAGALRGAASSVREMIFEVDAALCDESDALRNMPDSRLPQAVKAAAAGGRTEVLHELLRRFAQRQHAQMPRRRRRNILSSRMLSQLGERRRSRTRFPSNFRRFNNVPDLKGQASALAVEGGHVQTVRSLPAYGRTNFPLAIQSGNAEMVKVLLEKETAIPAPEALQMPRKLAAILWANEARFRMRGVAPPALRFPRRLSRRRLEAESLAYVKEFL